MNCKLIKAGPEMHLYCTDEVAPESPPPKPDAYMCVFPDSDPYKQICTPVNKVPPATMWKAIGESLWSLYEVKESDEAKRYSSFY